MSALQAFGGHCLRLIFRNGDLTEFGLFVAGLAIIASIIADLAR